MRTVVTVLLLVLFCLDGALAERPWYYPRTSSKAYVNPYLTPRRALLGEWAERFEGQLVLWHGRAISVHSEPPQRLELVTPDGTVPVRFSRPVKNLQTDRHQATVAIKGHVRRDSSGALYLEGRSVIPWRPPSGYQQGPPLLDQWISFQRPELTPETRTLIRETIEKQAAKQELDPLFLASLIQIESGFDPAAVSVSGALGLGQLMPRTAQGLGVNPHDVADNIRGCAQMVGRLVRNYNHRDDGLALVLASYNAGPTLVAQTKTVPHYEETVNYVYFIGSLYEELSRQSVRLTP